MGRCRQQPLAYLGQRLRHHEPAFGLGGRQARQRRQVAEQSWTHDMPKGPKGRFVGALPFFFGVWGFSKNKQAAKDLLLYISQKEQARKLVAASSRLRPAVVQVLCTTSRPGRRSSRRTARSTTTRRAATSRLSIAALPARPDVGGPDLQLGDQDQDDLQGQPGQREDRRHRSSRPSTSSKASCGRASPNDRPSGRRAAGGTSGRRRHAEVEPMADRYSSSVAGARARPARRAAVAASGASCSAARPSPCSCACR